MPKAAMRLGYLIPEWPGQSHVWAWREITQLRSLGVAVTILSTRRPQPADLGRHEFAALASGETIYLWPRPPWFVLKCLAWAAARRPRGLLQCIRLAIELEGSSVGAVLRQIALIVPATVLAAEVRGLKLNHLHTPIPARSALLCMMAQRLTNTPYSMTIVSGLHGWQPGLCRKLEEARFTTVVADYLLQDILLTCPTVQLGKLRVARHGVDTRRWIACVPARIASPGPPRLLSIGRLTGQKGFDILLHAVALLRQRAVQFELTIVGEGPQRAELESLTQELDLQESVRLAGSCSEGACLGLMHSATVFVLASRTEGTPVVCMEAMATGVPVVATAVGGIPEIIEHGVNGILIPPESPTDVADAIEKLLADPDLRKRLAREARRTVVEQLDCRIGASILLEMLTSTATGIAPRTP